MAPDHVVWQWEHVVDVRDAAFAIRTYLEQADVRAIVAQITKGARLGAACEIGAGYGRLVGVLSEFADQVVAVEREPHLAREGARLLPAVRFVQVESLTALPLEAAGFDVVLTFTVLQHLVDPVAQEAAREIGRIMRPGGHLLICEETDPLIRSGDVDDPRGMCTIGRPIPVYQDLFRGFDLVVTKPRRIEPTYPRAAVGDYLLFRKPSLISQGPHRIEA
jgi:SAM-dependent methyltransferase